MTNAQIKAHRIKLTAPTAQALRDLACEALRLADRIENHPGDGIGLAYAAVYQAWSDTDRAMRDYQNTPLA